MKIEISKCIIENNIREIFQSYYNRSKEIALSSEEGRVFTDHNDAHVKMVLTKTNSVLKSIKQYMLLKKENNSIDNFDYIPFSCNINPDIITAIALSHDSGMCGLGYTFCKDSDGVYTKQENGYYKMKTIDCSNYSQIRVNHGLNSAIIVLQNRESLRKIGYSDIDVDEIATICMSHFISTSGVIDLNSKYDWSECFLRLNSAIYAYNNDNKTSPISFNSQPLKTEEYMSILATETLAIRLGDVSRDSGPDAESQSGEIISVDRNSFNNKGDSIESELKNAQITIGDTNTAITFLKSRQVHAGEQNIIYNDTHVEMNNSLVHSITVQDGNSAPKCTQTAIYDHARVLASTPKENFYMEIQFLEPCDSFSKQSYENFRNECITKYKNICIIYPWDKKIS